MLDKPPLSEHLMKNIFFDTCVYHQRGIDLLFDVIDLDNILFGSEMVGAVRGIDAETGHYFDDTKRYVDALDLTEAQRTQVFAGNARRVFPRLDASLKARGRS
jgi:4-oxalmesaconate hydratase